MEMNTSNLKKVTAIVMPDVVYYHKNCADGFGAALAVWMKFPGMPIDFIPVAYGDTVELTDIEGKNVYVVDFSFDVETTKNMAAVSKSLTVLDHHKTAQAALEPLLDEGLIDGVFDMEHSGAYLTWKWLYPNGNVPKLIQIIQDRDLWKFEFPYTRDVQAALFSYPYDFITWRRILEQVEYATGLFDLQREGVAIERKHLKDIKELLDVSHRTMRFKGVYESVAGQPGDLMNVPTANLPYTMASDACQLLMSLNRKGMAATYYDGKDARYFSLRSNNDDIDVSFVAKQYGGGGHKRAAGFQMPLGWEGETEIK